MRDAEVEPSIAADPARPDALIGAWQQDRDLRGGAAGIESAASTDGGRTWKEALVPGLTKCSNGPYIRASDPWVSAGPGRAYLGTINIINSDPNVCARDLRSMAHSPYQAGDRVRRGLTATTSPALSQTQIGFVL